MKMSMIGSRYSGCYMRGRPLPRSLCDGHLLVLCILPCRNHPIT
jgi:hypothetical protein